MTKFTPRDSTGHRIADIALRLGVHPIAPAGKAPPLSMCAVARNGDLFDLADVFEAIVARLPEADR